MDIRLGTDIVYIPRIKAAIDRFGDRFLQRIYTLKEQHDCLAPNSATATSAKALLLRQSASLAGRWAAKEAVAKALGTGWSGIGYTDIEIQRQANGEPQVHLYGAAAEQAAVWGGNCWQISLSHDRDYAIATAILYYSSSISS